MPEIAYVVAQKFFIFDAFYFAPSDGSQCDVPRVIADAVFVGGKNNFSFQLANLIDEQYNQP